MRALLRTLALAASLAIAPTLMAQAKPATVAKAGSAKTAAAHATVTLVDINKASVADLEAIAGIGTAYSAKIIAGRPYANKTQLLQKKILPKAVYEKVKNHIIAKQ